MAAVKKSRRRPVRARGKSNSRAVPTRNSAARKSAASSGNENVLRVRTPKESRLRYLRDAGVIVPEEIPSDEDSVPLDFTRLSNRGIGHLQSRYAVRHAHAIFNAAKVADDVAILKRELRMEKAKFRMRHKDEPLNVVQAMMEDDDEIVEIESKLLEVETHKGMLDAVAQGYADLRDAASREITRRLGERAAVD